MTNIPSPVRSDGGDLADATIVLTVVQTVPHFVLRQNGAKCLETGSILSGHH